MKKIIAFLAIVILYCQMPLMAAPQQDFMNVVAPSGLKLRATPGMDSEVLYIIPSKSVVQIIENELFPRVEDEISYISGSWVYVNYEGEEGYVFDGFLSDLPLPIHEFEKTQFDLDLIYPLETWMEYHHVGLMNTDTFASSLYTKVVYEYEEGNKMSQKNTSSHYTLSVELSDARIFDAYHLLTNMLSSKSEISEFTQKAVFVRNNAGIVDKIKIDIEEPILIKKLPNGNILIEIKSYSKGCTIDLTRL
jgi:hypothetical protein